MAHPEGFDPRAHLPKDAHREMAHRESFNPLPDSSKRQGHFSENFRQIGQIGQGGQGEVYKVQHRHPTAVKKIKLKSEDELKYALREILHFRILNSPSDHPGSSCIVKYYDAWEELEYFTGEKLAYIHMELCEGGNLHDYMKTRRSDFRVLEICKSIANGVDFMHSLGLMHRDLKPANIFLTRTGQVKIGDYGFAKGDSQGLTNSKLQDHTWCGTEGYMAPEVVSGNQYNKKSDIYSMGKIFQEIFISHDMIEKFTGVVADTLNHDPALRPTAEEIIVRVFQ